MIRPRIETDERQFGWSAGDPSREVYTRGGMTWTPSLRGKDDLESFGTSRGPPPRTALGAPPAPLAYIGAIDIIKISINKQTMSFQNSYRRS